VSDPTPNNERRWVCVNEVHYGLPCNESTPHSVCARYYAAPVPSPVPSRPDTAQIRAMADEITTTGSGFPGLDTLDALTLILAADWIDAQPAADQGPDLSELRAARGEFVNTPSSVVDPVRFTDAAYLLFAAVDRLLDLEGGA